jgi:hypothetical protein
MEIAVNLIPSLPRLRAIIFEIMPERVAEVGLAAIGRQLGEIKDLCNVRPTRSNCCACSARKTDARESPEPPIDVPAWNILLGSAVTGLALPEIDVELAAWWHAAAPALSLYRLLVGEGRASAVASAAPRTTRLLLQQLGKGTRQLLAEFWLRSPPGYTVADEAAAFLRFLSESDRALPGLPGAVSEDLGELVRLCSWAPTGP